MRKISFLGLALFLLLAGCAPQFEKRNEVVQDSNEEKEKAIIPKYKISDEYYRIITPFKPAKARGLVVANLNTRYDINEFETGLTRIAQENFDTEKYLFQEGQVLEKDTVRLLLNRQFTKAQLKENEMKDKDNIGLNPLDPGKGSIADRNTKNPIYLAHILEHDYLLKDDKNNVSLGGVVIGLALNSVHYYQKEEFGATFETEIAQKTMEQEGKKIAEKLLQRLRGMDELKNVPITIALFEQKENKSVVPGNFFAYTHVDNGSSNIGSWEPVKEKYVLFPSGEAEENHRDDLTAFKNFKQDVETYFPNFNGVVGKAFYVEDQLQDLSIDIPIQFYGKSEAVGFTQYVTGIVMEHFPEYISVQVEVSSVNGPEALIVRKAETKEPFVHIYK
ncbi:CamS family sex pheromone protein [Peribacillus saganii]|uniref:CamS family sex pheromone protein n=1 Tax=Peribacillus saganii TaxID=2303992 RepID=A0A372LN13_9BACI|nr:CamS family sex pheromone protein [Peribacillus saganii]RFU68918.1 CamS family sex pheromone protein [Peribacillus saganii]